MSEDPFIRDIELKFLGRLGTQEGDGVDLTSRVYDLVAELDQGVADAVIAANEASIEIERAKPERFEDVVEFSVTRWAGRRRK